MSDSEPQITNDEKIRKEDRDGLYELAESFGFKVHENSRQPWRLKLELKEDRQIIGWSVICERKGVLAFVVYDKEEDWLLIPFSSVIVAIYVH